MKKTIISIIAFLLCFAMLFVCSCQSNENNDNYELEYTLSKDGKYYVVTGIGNCKGSVINIPSTYKELPVKEIGSRAFANATGITTITISDSITNISTEALKNCTELVYNTHDNAKYLGSENNKYLYLIEADDSTRTIKDSTKIIGNKAFANCKSLTDINIPNSVIKINDMAFDHCTKLESVTIGDRVTTIGENAFGNCTSLKNVTIPSGITSIGDTAFLNCSKLIYNIYNKAKYLGNENNKYLYLVKADKETMSINGSARIIGASAFSKNKAITRIVVPNNVISIGKEAFRGCESLISISIGKNVKNIGTFAFRDCVLLMSVKFENTNGWKADGKSMSVTDEYQNAINFKSTYEISWTRS